jgi:methionine synthase I (cobalamin-dependent)
MKNNNQFLKCIRQGGLLFDGGLGSMLIADGLQPGSCPEEWNRSRPETLSRVHKSYLDAGARVITTNTFGATPARLEKYRLLDALGEFNAAAITLARNAVEEFTASLPKTPAGKIPPAFVAFSMGPTDKMLPPLGQAAVTDVDAEYAAQLQSVNENIDLVVIETIFDLREAIIACESVKRLTEVPVGVTLTFSRTPKGFFTVMGDGVMSSLHRLEQAGADFVGANCSITSTDMLELAKIIRNSTDLPVLCQPNAGNPVMKDKVLVYEQRPEEFAQDAIAMLDKGVNAVGGCCGTTPDFIREVAERIQT